jgi:hypothetical protein
VNVDDAVKGPKLPAEDAFGELLTRKDSSGGAQKSLEQRELHAGQLHRPVVQPDFTRYGIKAEIPRNQGARGSCKLRGPPQNGAKSCKEFAWIKRLGQIVVRSDLEPENSVHVLSPGGKDQHGNGRLRAQPAKNVQTPDARQHEIEDDKGVFTGESALKSPRPIVHGFDREPLGLKTLREKSAQLNIIIDDENAIHSLPPAASDSILDHPSAGTAGFTKLYLA